MIFTFDKSLLLVMVLVFLKGVHCENQKIIFSYEYDSFLQYPNANKTQFPKCELINICPASTNLIFDHKIFNKTSHSLKNTKPTNRTSNNSY